MIRMIVRNLLIRKTRTFLTILGISIGIGMIVSLVSITEGLSAESSKAFGDLERVIVEPDQILGKLPAAYADEIEEIPGVSIANPSITVLPSTIEGVSLWDNLGGGGLIPTTIVGYDSEKIVRSPGASIPNSIITGRFLMQSDTYSAVLGKAVAEAYNLRYRSTVDVDGTKLQVIGIYETGMMISDNTIVVPLKIAQNMANMDKNHVSAIYVDVNNSNNINRIAKTIEYRFDDVKVTTPEELQSQFGQIQSTISTATWVIASVAAIVGGIGVINSMAMNVMERRREIGIMKAVGWSRSEVLRTFLLESTIMGFTGGVTGILIGVVGTSAITEFIPALITDITPRLMLQVMVFSTLLGGLGGLYPAWQAASVDPIEALRYA